MRTHVTLLGIEFDLKLTLLIIFSVVVPMLDYYNHHITGTKAYDRFILYFILPTLVILLLFREPLSSYGFQIGNWRAGLLWTAAGCAGMALILWFIARSPAMQQYYRRPSHLPKRRRAIWLGVFVAWRAVVCLCPRFWPRPGDLPTGRAFCFYAPGQARGGNA
jgi:hypothetical protein